MKKHLSNSGFTLIELLVVVLVIGALSGIVVSMINSAGLRSKARDSQRIADLKKLQTALELYFADNRQYPPSGWIAITDSDDVSTALSPTYINDVPTDPLLDGPVSNPCSTPDDYRYNYKTTGAADGSEYILTAMMEVTSSNDNNQCSDLNNWGSFGSCGSYATGDYCYGVENP